MSDELLGRGRSKRTAAKPEDTAWLNELVNELQDVISHRHMEQVRGRDTDEVVGPILTGAGGPHTIAKPDPFLVASFLGHSDGTLPIASGTIPFF